MLCNKVQRLYSRLRKVPYGLNQRSCSSSSRLWCRLPKGHDFREGCKSAVLNNTFSVSKAKCHVYEFHTSRRCDAIPPVLVAFLRPLANIVAVLVGRSLRRWWQSLTPKKRQEIYENLKKNRYKFLGGATIFSFAGFCYYQLHIVESPITKRKRFILFSKKELSQLADLQRNIDNFYVPYDAQKLFHPYFLVGLAKLLEDNKKLLVPSEHILYRRVSSVASRIIQKNKDLPGVQDGPWTVFVIQDPHQRNAFVLPNKSIFVFSGMLDVCTNDDQLAIILAHEIAHVLLSHMEENLSRMHFVQIILLAPVLLFWAILPNEVALFSHWLTDKITHLMIELPFNRHIETEADEVGLQMMAKACYDVREASKLWEKMDKISSGKENDETVEWLSTHPSFINRKNHMDERIPSALLLRESCKCPPLPNYKI